MSKGYDYIYDKNGNIINTIDSYTDIKHNNNVSEVISTRVKEGL